jgi:membrane protein DedA with SNARE-associated domain/rhodanese-related sulfurtransferase
MQSLLSLLEQHGLWLVFFNVLALQLGLPLPAYPTLIVVGALSVAGPHSALAVLAVGVTACMVADATWYTTGRRAGRRVLRGLCRVSLNPDSCVRQTERIYQRWGAPSLMVAKFIPGFAAVATSMAGLLRTPFATRFLPFDAMGALLWVGLAVSLGRLFHTAVEELLDAFAAAGRWGLALLLSLLALHLAIKAVQRQRLIRQLRMSRISVQGLQQMLKRGERPLIVDVRAPMHVEQERIPGALWIDAHAFEDSVRRHALEDRFDEEVIVYCACPNEASAAAVAKRLMKAGFRRVRPLEGGIEAWREAGYEVLSTPREGAASNA